MKAHQESGDDQPADHRRRVHRVARRRFGGRGLAARHRADDLHHCKQRESTEEHHGALFTVREEVDEGPEEQSEQHRVAEQGADVRGHVGRGEEHHRDRHRAHCGVPPPGRGRVQWLERRARKSPDDDGDARKREDREHPAIGLLAHPVDQSGAQRRRARYQVQGEEENEADNEKGHDGLAPAVVDVRPSSRLGRLGRWRLRFWNFCISAAAAAPSAPRMVASVSIAMAVSTSE